jgi:DnaK suppressor protein
MASGMRSSVKSKYETYRKILEKKAAEVQSSMSAQKAAQVLAREEHPHDEGDLSQQSHEEWIFLNRNTLDIKLLREVQDALRRIDQGTYGVCYECEEPISSKRLDAVPWAKFCVSCQERIAANAAAGHEEAFQEADR